jgi:epoxyqueuosine reductase QueG
MCIAYLTIELKGEIPVELRPLIGELVYGCDICQSICPWNEKFARPVREDAFRPRETIASKNVRTLARELLAMSDEDFRKAFKGSPMKREAAGTQAKRGRSARQRRHRGRRAILDRGAVGPRATRARTCEVGARLHRLVRRGNYGVGTKVTIVF